MRAEIISIGTELLLGEIVDTNAAFLRPFLPIPAWILPLAACGIAVFMGLIRAARYPGW